MKIDNHNYTIGRLNALDQLHVSRKIAPIVPNLIPIISEVAKGGLAKAIEAIDANSENLDGVDISNLDGLSTALAPLMNAIAAMSEDDTNYVIHKTLSVVHREGAILCRGESIMFDDLDMMQILPLVIAVIRHNLGNFIQGLLMKASNIQQSG
ncbi:phage tail assembly chaperone [Acinetobacter radioresistens]|uniref:phage tail assembly chaperone n=1 Tax=Acinetobacter radioresistens TaxID=40216 RepID=UPI000E7174D7|nr:hypothetical protein [Acinetobacter radioresistens]RJL71687.1 hypothetical protein D5055_08315 [Acinetobacter radioresistens]